MDMADVDRYVDGASEEVIACRERGRHLWPSMRKAKLVFTDVTEDGLLVRRVLCECCQLARRIEYWETVGRGRNTRYQPVGSSIEYLTGSDGERYLGPQGRGRMTNKMIRNSMVTAALHGQSPAMVRQAAKRAAALEKEATQESS